MKQCPVCQRTYDDATQMFCLNDGSLLSALPEPAQVVPVETSAAQAETTALFLPPLPAAPKAPAPSLPSLPAMPTAPVSPSLPPLPPASNAAPSFAPQYAPPAPTPSNKTTPLYAGGAILVVLLLIGVNRLMIAKPANPTQTPIKAPAEPNPAPPFGEQPVAPDGGPPAAAPPVTAPGTNAPPEQSALAAALAAALRLADDTEIQALRTLDPAPLYQAYTGEALQAELKKVQDLKANGLFEGAHLDGQEIQGVKLSPDGSRAEIRLVETWSAILYSVGNRQATRSQAAQRQPQIISLVRSKAGWLVYSDVPQ